MKKAFGLGWLVFDYLSSYITTLTFKVLNDCCFGVKHLDKFPLARLTDTASSTHFLTTHTFPLSLIK